MGLGFLNLEYSLAIKRLSKDMRDDWFSDALLYKDFLEREKVKKYFSSKSFSNLGQEAEQFNLPKPGFTLRYALETFIYDRLLYQALIDKLIEVYDPLFSSRVYSHRLQLGKGNNIFQHGIEAWRSFIRDVASELKVKKGVLLVTDIRDYYECISIKELDSILRSEKCSKVKAIDGCIEVLILLLRKWAPDSVRGIPQNQDASSFLGNVYMSHIDKRMISMKYNYFRYMDDIRIVCKDEFAARKALKNLIINLRRIGLNVNSKKTKILEVDLNNKDYTDCMPPPNRTIEEIDALWKQRTIGSIRAALPKLKAYTEGLISTGKTHEREFRFCVHRLEQVARCKVLNFDFSGIIDAVIDLLVSQPASSDYVVRLLRVAPLEYLHIEKIKEFALDKNKNIYEWQGYLVWQLLIMLSKQYAHDNKKFRNLAKDTIVTKHWDPPMKAGAILYLGAFGNKLDKLYVLKNFPLLRSRLVTRAAIIASQEVSESNLKKYVYPNVSQEFIDSLNTMRKPNFNGIYLEPLPPLNPRELFDNLPAANSF
jgi:hypothetical protein